MKRKYYIIPILLLIVCFCASAQENQWDDEFKTIFGGRNLGGYGAVGMGYTLVENRPGICFDGRAGAMLTHSLAVGVAGAGFINSDEEITALNQRIFLSGGYGGVYGEFVLFPKSPVHISFPVLAGLGAMTAASLTATQSDGSQQNHIERTIVFMIVEPAVELEFSFTRSFRLAGFFSYRFTTDVRMEEDIASSDALNNYSAGLRVKFGKF